MLENKLGLVVDWSRVDKEEYLLSMERSPVRDWEIKHLLRQALTDQTEDRTIFMKGIDRSYDYEGYAAFRAEEL